ncbi:hypothetical protein MHU86_2673 [Fragilaria crotonensis]|nr:hypothetical protein MHU86_2673 [Fragilaria crotonensis]
MLKYLSEFILMDLICNQRITLMAAATFNICSVIKTGDADTTHGVTAGVVALGHDIVMAPASGPQDLDNVNDNKYRFLLAFLPGAGVFHAQGTGAGRLLRVLKVHALLWTWDGRALRHCMSVSRPDGEGAGWTGVNHLFGTFTAAKEKIVAAGRACAPGSLCLEVAAACNEEAGVQRQFEEQMVYVGSTEEGTRIVKVTGEMPEDETNSQTK